MIPVTGAGWSHVSGVGGVTEGASATATGDRIVVPRASPDGPAGARGEPGGAHGGCEVLGMIAADPGLGRPLAGPADEGAKPAGLTFIGAATTNDDQTVRHQWTGDRWENRRDSVNAALTLLAQTLEVMR